MKRSTKPRLPTASLWPDVVELLQIKTDALLAKLKGCNESEIDALAALDFHNRLRWALNAFVNASEFQLSPVVFRKEVAAFKKHVGAFSEQLSQISDYLRAAVNDKVENAYEQNSDTIMSPTERMSSDLAYLEGVLNELIDEEASAGRSINRPLVAFVKTMSSIYQDTTGMPPTYSNTVYDTGVPGTDFHRFVEGLIDLVADATRTHPTEQVRKSRVFPPQQDVNAVVRYVCAGAKSPTKSG